MIKKWFFDMWDHFLPVILMNLGFILVLVVPFLLPSALLDVSVGLSIFSLVVGVLIFFVYSAAVSFACREIANYQSPTFKQFFSYFRETWLSGLILGLIYSLHVLIVWVAFPVYSSMGNLLGLAAIVFLFWASVIWLLASQFYFPIRSRLDTKIKKVIRKTFIIFFDNTFFSIVVGVGTVAIFILSGFTAFLIPGITGLMLWQQVALKLRLYKYDYIEEHPDADRKRIPWTALLIDEKERVGKRTLRGMIFPWKE